MSSFSIIDSPPAMVKSFSENDMYRTLYKDITANGTVLQFVDRHALGVLAVSLCQYESFAEDIQTKGAAMTVEGDRAMVTKRNPSLDAAQKLYPVILKLMAEFQMTPSSRGKKMGSIGEVAGINKNDGWDEV